MSGAPQDLEVIPAVDDDLGWIWGHLCLTFILEVIDEGLGKVAGGSFLA